MPAFTPRRRSPSRPWSAQSVYFVAGNVLYRVNAATGAICWKHTLALRPDDAITDLAFVGGEIRASGPGV